MPKLLDLQNICISAGDTKLVQNLNMHLKPGERVGLVGETGSGKSLTAYSVMGLLSPKLKFSGKIIYDGKNIANSSPRQLQKLRAKEISMIFQEPLASLNPLHTLEKQLAEAISRTGTGFKQELKDSNMRELVNQQLARVELSPDLASKYPHQISGGQRQRVLIAMMIAHKPRLLIADEPTTALDRSLRFHMLERLSALCKESKMALLLITHDINTVLGFTERIYVLKDGQLLEKGKSRQVFQKPRHSWTKHLLAAANLKRAKAVHGKKQVLLKVDSLQVNYPIRGGLLRRVKSVVPAVKPVSFSLKAGETLGIIGESGSGKSSLALALLRLLKDDEWSGDVKIKLGDKQRGADVFADFGKLQGKYLRALRPKMQMIFQDPFSSLNPRLTIRQSVVEGVELINPELDEELIAKTLQKVKLSPDLLYSYPHSLSGGQRQRVAIARALLMRPRLLVLDEPTSSLDATVQLEIVDLLRELQRAYALGYIFITHDLNLAAAMSNSIFVLRGGEVVERGDAGKVLRSPKHAYTKQLLHGGKFKPTS